MKCFLAFISLVIAYCSGELTSLAELNLDENMRLTENYMLYEVNGCNDMLISWNRHHASHARTSIVMSKLIADQFRANSSCAAVCLNRGVHYDLITEQIPELIFGNSATNTWIDFCQSAEIGFVSHMLDKEASIYWLSPKGERHLTNVLKYGERNTIWINSFLGHTFEVVDSSSQDLLLSFTVQYDCALVFGEDGSHLGQAVDERLINKTFHSEWNRASKVKRTFTELGFSKGRVPRDLWSSMSSYHYNNRNNLIREEWETKGFFVNWWEATPYMITMPPALKKLWQRKLRFLVQTWIGGYELEDTDIYGIRVYTEGARLLTHTDRESTHATSLIINVDQFNMREPWMVEIYDFAGRLHEISMEPRDIVYYEVSINT
jgi:hypothetical protein